MTDALRRELLARLPDSARWAETRGALLADEAELFGTAGGCLVRDRLARLLSVVGEPGREELGRALEGVEGPWTLICVPEAGPRWSRLLPGWTFELATLHELPEGALSDLLSDQAPDQVPGTCSAEPALVAPVAGPRPGLLEHLPQPIRREVADLVGRRPVIAAWVGGRAVSFCCAGHETETLWDVSVETLPRFRRRGLAAACSVRLIREMAARGKRPVWGAVESNAASLGLAAKLGFRPVDRLSVLEGHPREG